MLGVLGVLRVLCLLRVLFFGCPLCWAVGLCKNRLATRIPFRVLFRFVSSTNFTINLSIKVNDSVLRSEASEEVNIPV